MTQRTFNQINRSPEMNTETDDEQMQVETPPKSKRGRKRQNNEEGLSEAERIKKEKNRKAAQKCREKKEKEAKDLKSRNSELEKENKKLIEEKELLKKRAFDYYKIVKEHVHLGCKLPSDVQEVYTEDSKLFFLNGDSNDSEVFQAVGTIEREHTPPSTPLDSSPEAISPSMDFNLPSSEASAPTALFSGTPLTGEEMAKRRGGSTSRSSSSSPAPPVSPGKLGIQMLVRHGQPSCSPHSSSSSSSTSLGKPIRQESQLGSTMMFALQSGQFVPTVVSDLDDALNSSAEYITKSFVPIDKRGNNNAMSIDQAVIEAALQMPDVSSEDVIATQASDTSCQAQVDQSSQNLPSLGFNCPGEYSYAEDLQQMETVQQIFQYTDDSNMDYSSEISVGQPVDVTVFAPALLDICNDMSESLQQQIKTSYSGNTISAPVPDLMQARTNVTQQNISFVPRQGHVQLTTKPDIGQQKTLVLNGQTYAVKQEAPRQNFQVVIENLPEQSTVLTTGQNELTETNAQKEFMRQLQKILLNQNAQKAAPSRNQGHSQIQGQVTDQTKPHKEHVSLINAQKEKVSIVGQSSKDISLHQDKQQMIPASMTNRNIILSIDNSTKAHVRTQQPITVGSQVSYPGITVSGGLNTPQQNSQLSYVVVENSKRYLANSSQSPNTFFQSLSASSAAQVLASGNLDSDLTFLPVENIDYSANVQDLPSLNLQELQSEKNLFDKARSKPTS